MEESFLLNVKQEMPPWVAKVHAAQVADGSRGVYERFIGELLARIPDPCNLIDVVCGTGHICELLATRLPQAEVVGVDLSDTLIDIARQKRENLSFEVDNVLALRFKGEPYDVAISVNSIKAWPDRQLGINQMTRVIRSGG